MVCTDKSFIVNCNIPERSILMVTLMQFSCSPVGGVDLYSRDLRFSVRGLNSLFDILLIAG